MDYGNEDVVAKSKLRPGLDNKLFSLPPQVHLYTVHVHVFSIVCIPCLMTVLVYRG